MAKAVLVGTLVLFVLLGICSSVLVTADWNALTSGDGLAGLSVLLFFIGAGIGASVVLLSYWGWCFYNKRRNKRVAAVAAAAAAAAEVDKKIPEVHNEKHQEIISVKDNAYDVHVHHMHTTESYNCAKMTDASLLSKLGLSVKGAMHKLSNKMRHWNSGLGGEMLSPTHKSLEKTMQNVDALGLPTPRIYVLPPDDDVEGTSAAQMVQITRHSRSRSEIPVSGKMGKPDVTILDITKLSKDSEQESEDLESGGDSDHGTEVSEMNSHAGGGDSEELHITTATLPEIRTIDAQLGAFVQSLSPSKNKATYMLSVMIEEVLPRPDSGLLKRMLRMSEIPVGRVEGSGEPILHLRVGSECHISIGLIKLDKASASLDISGPHRITFKPLDGEAVDLNANCEAVDNVEHVTSAIWDLKSHASRSLTRASSGDSTSTVLTPIEMTLAFHVHSQQEGHFIQEIEVKKTFMASMRRDLVSLDVDQRFTYEDAVLDFVLSKMELISMPSLLMFLQVDGTPPRPSY